MGRRSPVRGDQTSRPFAIGLTSSGLEAFAQARGATTYMNFPPGTPWYTGVCRRSSKSVLRGLRIMRQIEGWIPATPGGLKESGQNGAYCALMNIKPDETKLVGKWVLEDGRPVADDAAKRIGVLTKSHLLEISHDASGWLTLYRDPIDGRLWELDYPQNELHGGGPPRLRVISSEEAHQRYGVPEL